MRKKLTALILIFYLVNVLAKSPITDDIKVNGKSVNIVKVKQDGHAIAKHQTEPVCSEEKVTEPICSEEKKPGPPSASCSEEKSLETGKTDQI